MIGVSVVRSSGAPVCQVEEMARSSTDVYLFYDETGHCDLLANVYRSAQKPSQASARQPIPFNPIGTQVQPMVVLSIIASLKPR